jgi:hypothetical protein
VYCKCTTVVVVIILGHIKMTHEIVPITVFFILTVNVNLTFAKKNLKLCCSLQTANFHSFVVTKCDRLFF